MRVGSRCSRLARAQVEEVRALFGPFEVLYVETTGDLDKKSSLRVLQKSDFFTKELDEMLRSGKIDAAIHSAKDLPEPLPEGLQIAHLTKGIDSRDSLVFLKGWTQETVPSNLLVATSSERREGAVRAVFPNARFKDLRGTIEERLLDPTADAVVIAEAALIRLELTHLPRQYLPGKTAEGQGKLAIVIRIGDKNALEFFRKKSIRSIINPGFVFRDRSF